MSRQLSRLLRVRRLMEEMSRAEFAHLRVEQAELEARRDGAHEAAVALRGKARVSLQTSGEEAPGLWRRYMEDSESTAGEAERWDRAAQQVAERARAAMRRYMEDRRSRMQAEILLREQAAAEQLERERREQREIDDWFGMGRRVRERGS
jgi:hypothetical protein